MSGLIKGVGKAFKKVGKVLKKVALPALAIGAVVLTGGAALGALPSLGSVAGSLGLSSGLTSVLTSAARMATMGAATSALTGGNIVKGATNGFMIGGALGGAGALLNPATAAAQTASAAGDAATVATDTAATLPGTGAQISLPTGVAAQEASQLSLGDALAWKPTGLPAAGGGGVGIGSALSGLTGQNGALSFLNDPIVRGSMVQGIGTALMASAQAKEARRQREEEAASYDTDPSSFYSFKPVTSSTATADAGTPLPYANARVVYDRNTGASRIVQGG